MHFMVMYNVCRVLAKHCIVFFVLTHADTICMLKMRVPPVPECICSRKSCLFLSPALIDPSGEILMEVKAVKSGDVITLCT